MLEPIPFAGMVEIDQSFDRTASHMAGEYVPYNEPVAWISCLACGQKVTGDSIHTCSPQLKTLTDEEIRLLINDVRDYDIDTHDLFEFARAILRKAQEKCTT